MNQEPFVIFDFSEIGKEFTDEEVIAGLIQSHRRWSLQVAEAIGRMEAAMARADAAYVLSIATATALVSQASDQRAVAKQIDALSLRIATDLSLRSSQLAMGRALAEVRRRAGLPRKRRKSKTDDTGG